LEAWHRLYCKYRPKDRAYGYSPSCQRRVSTAVGQVNQGFAAWHEQIMVSVLGLQHKHSRGMLGQYDAALVSAKALAQQAKSKEARVAMRAEKHLGIVQAERREKEKAYAGKGAFASDRNAATKKRKSPRSSSSSKKAVAAGPKGPCGSCGEMGHWRTNSGDCKNNKRKQAKVASPAPTAAPTAAPSDA
jgi:hypothetical protein